MDKNGTTIFAHRIDAKTTCLYKVLTHKKHVDKNITKFIIRFYWHIVTNYYHFKVLVRIRCVGLPGEAGSFTTADVYKQDKLYDLSERSEELLKNQSTVLARRIVIMTGG
jgi:hypothetical protein